ncbi:MAG: SGNH/GDSL hydrolase family protein [Pseudomonadota bacterium]
MRNLIFWSLFPFALPQAIHLKRTAPRYKPPGCPTEGVVGSGERLRLFGVGDSVVAGVGMTTLGDALVGQATVEIADRLGRAVHWSVHGRSGARAQHLLEDYLPDLPAEPADVVILSVGVNDITGMTMLPVFRRRLGRLLDRLQQHSPNAVIGVSGLPPLDYFPLLPEPLRFASGQRGRAFDRAARRLVDRRSRVVHMPVEFEARDDNFCADGFHPSVRSHQRFGRLMADLLIREMHA